MKRRKKHVLVLDFSHLLPGEYCTTLLADAGLDVLRIEPVKPGLNRMVPPVVEGESLYYWSVHRNKSCLRVDLKSKDGQKLVRKIARCADVVVENFRPGTMGRLGLGYKRLSRKNPGLVYCSISAFGQQSARNSEPSHDLNLQAEAGLLLAGLAPGQTPRVPGALTADYVTALSASTAVLGALYQRTLSGCGQHLDISMMQCAAQLLGYRATAHLHTGLQAEEGGFDFPRAMPNYAVYRCSDNLYLSVACIEPEFWRNFCELIGLSELALKPPAFDSRSPEVIERIEQIIATRTRAQWLDLFEGKRCCVSPVQSPEEMLGNADIAREALTAIHHDSLGSVRQLRAFALRRQAQADRCAPTDARTILNRFGISKRKVKRLVDAGTIRP